MVLRIRNQETIRAINEIAALTGETVDEVVITALTERIDRVLAEQRSVDAAKVVPKDIATTTRATTPTDNAESISDHGGLRE